METNRRLHEKLQCYGKASFVASRSRRKCVELEFLNGEIRWSSPTATNLHHVIPAKNVIAVKRQRLDPKTKLASFTIHHAEETKQNKWRTKALTLRHPDETQIALWHDALQSHVTTVFSHRPKSLLLFINPFGGKKRGLKVWEKHARPLFELAGVKVEVVVTQRQNQIRDKLASDNLEGFDAVGCVGGDGTVSEIINGLVLRECERRQVNPNPVGVEFPRPTLTVGIIPGGSTDTTAYCLHGTTDPTTAVVQIILGDTLGLDLVSVHDTGGFLKMYADVASYGFLGDIAYHSEKLRWMGPSRYEYTGFKKIMANAAYQGEISILDDKAERPSSSRCRRNCQECSLQTPTDKPEPIWRIIKGKFFMISGANISCAGDRNPNGLAPYCHLGDGFMHLLVIYHTSVFNSLLTLNRFTKSTYTTEDLENVEVYRTREFYFRAGSDRSRWNTDGEVMEETDIHARVHHQLLKVFGRGYNKK